MLYSPFKNFSFSFDFKVCEKTSVGSVTSVSFDRFNLKYRDFAIKQVRHVANTRFVNMYFFIVFQELEELRSFFVI